MAEARFTRIYYEHWREILAYAARRLGDPEDAAEIVEETFLVAWRRLADVPEGNEARLWLYGTARRTLANQRRGERRRERLTERLAREIARVLGISSVACRSRLMRARRRLRWFAAADRDDTLHSIYLLDARGRVVRRLAGPAPSDTEEIDPCFSPDGRWIVYDERRFLGTRVHDTLYAVRRDGRHRRRLTFGPESAGEPAFSPDGRWVAFVKSKLGEGGYVWALSFSNPRHARIIGLSSGYEEPVWGPR